MQNVNYKEIALRIYPKARLEIKSIDCGMTLYEIWSDDIKIEWSGTEEQVWHEVVKYLYSPARIEKNKLIFIDEK